MTRRMTRIDAAEYFALKERIIRENEADTGGDTTIGGQRLRAAVRDARDEPWAGIVIDRWEVAGSRRDYSAHGKIERRSIQTGMFGEVLWLPKRYAHPKRRDDGRRTHGYYLADWLFLPRADFFDIYGDQERQGARIDETRRGLRVGAALLTECPGAGTVFEACVRLGQDPEAIFGEASGE